MTEIIEIAWRNNKCCQVKWVTHVEACIQTWVHINKMCETCVDKTWNCQVITMNVRNSHSNKTYYFSVQRLVSERHFHENYFYLKIINIFYVQSFRKFFIRNLKLIVLLTSARDTVVNVMSKVLLSTLVLPFGNCCFTGLIHPS